MIDWTIIKTEYENTDQSIRTLAEKYGASKSAISKKSRAEHWTRPTRPLSTLSTSTFDTVDHITQPLPLPDASLSTQARFTREQVATLLSYGLYSYKEARQAADILLQLARVEELLVKLNPQPPARPENEIDYTQLADHELKEMQELMMKARILTD